jgi:hypothetical protein
MTLKKPLANIAKTTSKTLSSVSRVKGAQNAISTLSLQQQKKYAPMVDQNIIDIRVYGEV